MRIIKFIAYCDVGLVGEMDEELEIEVTDDATKDDIEYLISMYLSEWAVEQLNMRYEII